MRFRRRLFVGTSVNWFENLPYKFGQGEIKVKRILVLAMVGALSTGCAVLPHTLRVEAEHVSHPLAGWPCEPQSGSEDGLSQVSALVGWSSHGAYVEAGVGYNLEGKNGGGMYGPSMTGTVRVGYEINLRGAR